MNAKYEFYSIINLVERDEPGNTQLGGGRARCCSLVSAQSTFTGRMAAVYLSSTGALTAECATLAGVLESS
jgi:hypothetical protein